MYRSLARFATLALSAPLAVAGITSAHATTVPVTIPGCFGAADAIVCNLTATTTVHDAAFSVMYVTACAATCYDIPVTSVTPSGESKICYSYTNRPGTTTTSACSTQLADALGVEIDIRPMHEWLSCNNYGTVCTHQ